MQVRLACVDTAGANGHRCGPEAAAEVELIEENGNPLRACRLAAPPSNVSDGEALHSAKSNLRRGEELVEALQGGQTGEGGRSVAPPARALYTNPGHVWGAVCVYSMKVTNTLPRGEG